MFYLNSPSCAIFVLYKPDNHLLEKSIYSILNQVDKVYLFENEGKETNKLLYEALSSKVIYNYSQLNLGIAEAQNIILRMCKNENFKVALLSDQDTIYPKNYMSKMLPILNKDTSVIASCPYWEIESTDREFFIPGLSRLVNNKIKVSTDKVETEIIHAISSGMVINVDLASEIGGMDSELFIDWVDNDFCWRANELGYKIVASPDAVIRHQLGDNINQVLGRRFTQRSFIRDYYIIRNSLYLAMYRYFSIPYVRNYLLKKTIHHFIFSTYFSKNKINHLKYVWLAFSHGIRKRLGKM